MDRPFSNIIAAESKHIALLEPLFETYEVSIPEKDWDSMVTMPETLEETYLIGKIAEENNILMYEKFLDENIPNDVREVFEYLKAASEKHLSAFTKQINSFENTGERDYKK